MVSLGNFQKPNKPSEIIDVKLTEDKNVQPNIIKNDELDITEVREFTIIKFLEGNQSHDVVVIVINKDEMQVPVLKGKVFPNDKTIKLNIRHMDGKDIVIL